MENLSSINKPLSVVPSRSYFVNWGCEKDPLIIVGEQVFGGFVRGDYVNKACSFKLCFKLLNVKGTIEQELSFDDERHAGWLYHGDNMAKLADVDGDGIDEYVFPTQSGHILIVGKA